MEFYDNFFLPVDNLAEVKAFYGEKLGLKRKLDFSDSGMTAYRVGGEEPAIILKDTHLCCGTDLEAKAGC